MRRPRKTNGPPFKADGGQNRLFCRQNRLFGGQNESFCRQNRSFGGQNRLFCRQNRLFGGQNRLFCRQNRSFGGQNESFCRQNRLFGRQNESLSIVEDVWSLGFVKLGTVTYDSARYVAGYIQKKLSGPPAAGTYGGREPPFQLASRGLGRGWALANAEYLRQNLGCTINGRNVGLPRYYKKILDLPPEAFMEKALEKDKEIIDHYLEKGFEDLGLYRNRVYTHLAGKQREKNLYAKNALKKRTL